MLPCEHFMNLFVPVFHGVLSISFESNLTVSSTEANVCSWGAGNKRQNTNPKSILPICSNPPQG